VFLVQGDLQGDYLTKRFTQFVEVSMSETLLWQALHKQSALGDFFPFLLPHPTLVQLGQVRQYPASLSLYHWVPILLSCLLCLSRTTKLQEGKIKIPENRPLNNDFTIPIPLLKYLTQIHISDTLRQVSQVQSVAQVLELYLTKH